MKQDAASEADGLDSVAGSSSVPPGRKPSDPDVLLLLFSSRKTSLFLRIALIRLPSSGR
jgi:hypothetical protein